MRIMYKCIYIVVDNQGVVYKTNESAGITGENIQGRINIRFREISQTVEGIAYLEYKRYNPDIKDYEKGLIKMDSTKDDEGKIIMYSIPILSSLLKYTGNIEFQLRITENEIDNYIPVYKSQVFNLSVLEAINAEAEIPEEYPTWLDIANEKIQEIDNINISSKETTDGVEIDITNKDGVTTTNKVYNGKKGDKGDTGARGEQGIPGENGKDGYVQYEAGDNIKIENNVISAGVLECLEEENVYILTLDNNVNSEVGKISNSLSGTTDTEICGYFAEILNKVIPKLSGTLILNIINVGYVKNKINNGVFEWDYGTKKFFTIGIDYYGCRINYLDLTLNTNADGTYNVTKVAEEYKILSSNQAPTNDNDITNKKYVDDLPKSYAGYDTTKTQVLKNINGVLTWVTEE